MVQIGEYQFDLNNEGFSSVLIDELQILSDPIQLKAETLPLLEKIAGLKYNVDDKSVINITKKELGYTAPGFQRKLLIEHLILIE